MIPTYCPEKAFTEWLLDDKNPDEGQDRARLDIWRALLQRPVVRKEIARYESPGMLERLDQILALGDLAALSRLRQEPDNELCLDDTISSIYREAATICGGIGVEPPDPSPGSCGPPMELLELGGWIIGIDPDWGTRFVTKEPVGQALLWLLDGGQYLGVSIWGSAPIAQLLKVAYECTADGDGTIVEINDRRYCLRVTPDRNGGKPRRKFLPFDPKGQLVEHGDCLFEPTPDGLVPKFVMTSGGWIMCRIRAPKRFRLDEQDGVIYLVKGGRRIPCHDTRRSYRPWPSEKATPEQLERWRQIDQSCPEWRAALAFDCSR